MTGTLFGFRRSSRLKPSSAPDMAFSMESPMASRRAREGDFRDSSAQNSAWCSLAASTYQWAAQRHGKGGEHVYA